MSYKTLSKEELIKLEEKFEKQYISFKEKNLKLDMSRGKPGPDQLDLCMGMLDVFNSKSILNSEDGFDCRNYGCLEGIREARELMSGILDSSPDEVIIYGNSSLNIMYDTVSRSYTHGIFGMTPWKDLKEVKFICIVPGYDRHFSILRHFGIGYVNVPMLKDGPDMDMIEKLVAEDESIKGMWCVPKYSNPDGTIYSDKTVKRMAALKPRAKDFRIYWDNAYGVHNLYDDYEELTDILSECSKAGNPDMVYKFASTSKISFTGGGLAAMAASKKNIEEIKKQLFFQTIGHDKMNQLRHTRFFKDIDGIRAHMKKHALILRPKFEMVTATFEKELSGTDTASWTKPRGGYFISLNTMEGCAKEVVAYCKDAGVVLTPAGATFPDGIDPEDSNIRIAPSYPGTDELKAASELLCLCIKLVSVRKLLKNCK